MQKILTINLEQSYPTVEEARQILKVELERCRSQKAVAVKIIHGYGSSGVGGALRNGIRKSLALRRKEGKIKVVVFGEKWDLFDAMTQQALQECPDLGKDRDLRVPNPGISIVVL